MKERTRKFAFLIILCSSQALAWYSCGKSEKPIPEIIKPKPVYVEKNIHGFTVKILQTEEQNPITIKALAKMEVDLEALSALYAPTQLTVLRARPIWIELALTTGAAWYHPSKDWLIENGYNEDKAKCVEICNMSNYMAWSEQNQPYMVLHELCHLYHDQALVNGHNNVDVQAIYNQAKSSGKYEMVDYYNGANISKSKSYGINNAQEYFAELSEAYFGINDYYPFTYNELKVFDPEGFALMETIWGKRTMEYDVTAPSPALGWKLSGFYKKYLDAGIPVLASHRVDNQALDVAHKIVTQMLRNCPDVKAELINLKVRVGVIGKNEQCCDLPEHSDLYTAFPGTDWNARGRGYGATLARPLTSCGEENLLKLPNDRYAGQNILVHEFMHSIHLAKRRLDPDWDNRVRAAHQAAMTAGLWNNTYAATNYEEYLAVATQAFYNVAAQATPSNGVYNHVNTREELKAYDIVVYTIIKDLLSETLLEL